MFIRQSLSHVSNIMYSRTLYTSVQPSRSLPKMNFLLRTGHSCRRAVLSIFVPTIAPKRVLLISYSIPHPLVRPFPICVDQSLFNHYLSAHLNPSQFPQIPQCPFPFHSFHVSSKALVATTHRVVQYKTQANPSVSPPQLLSFLPHSPPLNCIIVHESSRALCCISTIHSMVHL